ncbi:hypothetical protein CFAM422_006078 [Trichoderma lentiforme]|uniref:Uncharacterized protein n=1 Tax=Trichoderma lentiforme TaxID=1567552 RepID=A0A9P4XF03_9HYPO|nr:hypothetical protein CFAM422_006078 [Trichoderma lentiforme]
MPIGDSKSNLLMDRYRLPGQISSCVKLNGAELRFDSKLAGFETCHRDGKHHHVNQINHDVR